MAKITASRLAKWAKTPPKKTEYVKDGGQPGLQIRRNVDGSIAFVARVRTRAGRQKRETFGIWPDLSLADARQAYRRLKLRAKSLSATAVTWDDVRRHYLQERRDFASYREMERLLHLTPTVWDRRAVDSMERLEIRSFLVDFAERISTPTMANRLHSKISAAFNHAIEIGLIDSRAHPIARMAKIYPEEYHPTVLRFDEIRALWAAFLESEAPACKAFRIMATTGCRPVEVCALQWHHIDGEWADIKPGEAHSPSARQRHQPRRRVRLNKSNRPHRVWLGPLALEAISELERFPWTDYLFPGGKDLKGHLYHYDAAIRTVRRRSGVDHFVPRHFRSTIATLGIRHGCFDSFTRYLILNHQIPGVTDAHYTLREAHFPAMEKGFKAYHQLIAGIVSGKGAEVHSFPSSAAG